MSEMRITSAMGAFAAAATFWILLGSCPAQAQLQIKVSDTTFMKFGVMAQAWADWQETPDPTGSSEGGTQQNLFLRRFRFQTTGQLVKDVSFLFVIDSSNVGKNKASGTSFTPALSIFDAFVQWKLLPEFQPQAGHFLVPLSRCTLLASTRLLTLDYAAASFSASTPTTSNTMRDAGFGATGFFLSDRLQYRVGVYQGVRDAGSRNPYRYAARLQYEFFETETGYLRQGYNYPGTYLGQRKVLAIGAGTDNQSTYHSYAADVFAEIPLASHDAPAINLGWFLYDGHDFLKSLPRQIGVVAEAGYYISKVKLQPFFQYQSLLFSDPAHEPNGWRRYQTGFHWYVSSFNFKVTGAFARLFPERPAAAPLNQFTLALQVFYF